MLSSDGRVGALCTVSCPPKSGGTFSFAVISYLALHCALIQVQKHRGASTTAGKGNDSDPGRKGEQFWYREVKTRFLAGGDTV
ncbi:hypothetical protein BT96DRAFT_191761 [Gymnopus androsaceus JB14]|uniref:Uncharacterized protein n=1 Tax=Gymnopus androsaceus JB14 TaxID=1447944 RepID=A0A6A4IC79_9AGAR|nr:hypothetical protein BT96DRAFT_191761 [Gymnopus androsaceus JB14]